MNSKIEKIIIKFFDNEASLPELNYLLHWINNEKNYAQYVEYINLMQQMHFELASDYLVMASTLAEIKSKMLVPNENEEEEEDDPRANLIKRLMEYQKYKELSLKLDDVPRLNRDTFIVSGILE